MNAADKHIGVIVGRWNEIITDQLRKGALEVLEDSGCKKVTLATVSGSWEIPAVAAQMLHKDCDAVIALGCILQGQTPHAQLLAGDVGSALMRLQVETKKPIGWGILTPDTQEQALDRAGLKMGNKGREAAAAVIEALSVLDQI